MGVAGSEGWLHVVTDNQILRHSEYTVFCCQRVVLHGLLWIPRFDRIILEPAFWLVRKWGIQLNTTHFWMCSHNVHRNSFRGNPELYQWHEAGELVWKFQLHFLLNRCIESLGLGPRRF
jgi:hypothetical protein